MLYYNMNSNWLDLNTDIFEIISDYVEKDNHERIQKIFKKHVKLYEGLDTNKESERIKNLRIPTLVTAAAARFSSTCSNSI